MGGMAHRLDGPRGKVERAKDHLADLRAEIGQFLARDPYGIVEDRDPETGQKVIRARVSEPVPPRVTAIIGDLAHNLRSGFDYVATQLVLANGATPSSRTEFPVFWDPEAYKTDFRRKVRGMSKEAVRLIDGMQPYLAADPVAHPLYLIHHLDIEDKHHDWIVVGTAIPSMVLGKGVRHMEIRNFRMPPRVSPLEDGAELWRYELGPGTDVDVEGEYAFAVAFDKAGVGRGQPVVPFCEQLINVCERGIETFAAVL
jgi:hypothetical protein